VKFWNELGWGFVQPEDGSADVFVNLAAIRPKTHLCGGDIVEYLATMGEKGLQANIARVVGWTSPSDPWDAFVDTGPPGWLQGLATLAENEPWDYKHTKAPEPLPVLRSYLRHTFRRLTEMDQGIAYAKEGRLAAFNTGLVSPHQEEIYCLCRAN